MVINSSSVRLLPELLGSKYKCIYMIFSHHGSFEIFILHQDEAVCGSAFESLTAGQFLDK